MEARLIYNNYHKTNPKIVELSLSPHTYSVYVCVCTCQTTYLEYSQFPCSHQSPGAHGATDTQLDLTWACHRASSLDLSTESPSSTTFNAASLSPFFFTYSASSAFHEQKNKNKNQQGGEKRGIAGRGGSGGSSHDNPSHSYFLSLIFSFASKKQKQRQPRQFPRTGDAICLAFHPCLATTPNR